MSTSLEAVHPLLIAAEIGDVSSLKKSLIDDPLSHGIQDAEGNTAIMVAVKRGHIEIVRTLVEAGASLTIRNKNQKSALYHAFDFNQIEILKYLLSVGVNIDEEREGKNPQSYIKSLKDQFGEKFDDLNTLWFYVTKMMQFAKHSNVVQMMQYAKNPRTFSESLPHQLPGCIKQGASVNQKDKMGRTPLHLAVIDAPHALAIETFYPFHPDVDAEDNTGKSAFGYFVEYLKCDEYVQHNITDEKKKSIPWIAKLRLKNAASKGKSWSSEELAAYLKVTFEIVDKLEGGALIEVYFELGNMLKYELMEALPQKAVLATFAVNIFNKTTATKPKTMQRYEHTKYEISELALLQLCNSNIKELEEEETLGSTKSAFFSSYESSEKEDAIALRDQLTSQVLGLGCNLRKPCEHDLKNPEKLWSFLRSVKALREENARLKDENQKLSKKHPTSLTLQFEGQQAAASNLHKRKREQDDFHPTSHL